MGSGDKKCKLCSYITRKGKVVSSFSCIEKRDQKEWKEWMENGFGVNFKKRTQPTRTHYNWWDWDFDRQDFSFHLWSIASVTYLIHSTLLSLTMNYRKKVETRLALRQ
jgi:hypothetical protein